MFRCLLNYYRYPVFYYRGPQGYILCKMAAGEKNQKFRFRRENGNREKKTEDNYIQKRKREKINLNRRGAGDDQSAQYIPFGVPGVTRVWGGGGPLYNFLFNFLSFYVSWVKYCALRDWRKKWIITAQGLIKRVEKERVPGERSIDLNTVHGLVIKWLIRISCARKKKQFFFNIDNEPATLKFNNRIFHTCATYSD